MGACCCKNIARSATRASTPPPPPPHLIDKAILRKDVSGEGSFDRTADMDDVGSSLGFKITKKKNSINTSASSVIAESDVDEIGSTIRSATRIVLAEGRPLDSFENVDGNAEEDAGDTRFSHLWREHTRCIGAKAKNSSIQESEERTSDPSESDWWPDLENIENIEPPTKEQAAKYLYPPVLFRGVPDQIDQLEERSRGKPTPISNPEAFRCGPEHVRDDDDGPAPFSFRRDASGAPMPPLEPPALYRGTLERITECTRESDFASEGDFAYDSDECEAQALKAMRDTAGSSSGTFPGISEEVAKQRSLAFMSKETDEDRGVQDEFRLAAQRRKGTKGHPAREGVGQSDFAPGTRPRQHLRETK